MGGKLFSAPRISNDDYHQLIAFFSTKFKELGRDVLFPESFKNKDSHGDLDIIVEGDVIPAEKLMEIFKLEKAQVSRNSDVISIYYQGKYQVDLCFHPKESYRSAYEYQRGGDAGNMVGRLAHALGFKYGHKGLLYPVKLSDCEALGEVVISSDTKKIHEFLDLDHDVWNEGFESPQAMYQWIIASKYFNPSMFAFENLNHINRIRNKKRPVYAGFVEYLENLGSWSDPGIYFEIPKNKSEYFWNSLIYFDNIQILHEINSLLSSYQSNKKANVIFNGYDIKETLFLDGKELGKVFNLFKEYCLSELRHESTRYTNSDRWERYRLDNDKQTIVMKLIHWYQNIYLKKL